MKLFYSLRICLAVVATLAIAACSSDDDNKIKDYDKGSISVTASIDDQPVNDFKGFRLVIKKGNMQVYSGDVPEYRRVSDLALGNDYTVELSSSPVASSDTPGYYGIVENVEVVGSVVPTAVLIELEEVEAGR